jgi:ketosteroid isomerase-like protein
MGNVEVIESAYAAFGQGDIAAILELVSDEVDWSSPLTLPQGGSFTGKDGVLRFFQGIGGAWDPLTVEVQRLGAISDDCVVAVVKGSGQLRPGGPANYGAAHVFTLGAGKIVRFQEFVDVDEPIKA